MKPVFLLFILTICLASDPVYAQLSLDGRVSVDSTSSPKVISYDNKFMARYIIASKSLRLHLREKGDQKQVVEYEPYGTGFIGIGGIYKKLGLEVMVRVPVRNDIDFNKHGITRSFDFQMNQYGRKFGVDLLIQRYKGFYVRNPAALYSGWTNKDAFPQRSDIIAWNTGLNVYYIFNHKNFSFRASFIQTERQAVSAGSFVLMTSVFRVSQEADSSIVPRDSDINFTSSSFLEEGAYYSLGILPGYAHTFVADRFYLTLSLFLGTGLQIQDFKVNGQEEKSYAVAIKSNLRSALGYNGKKVFTGVSFVTDNSSFDVNDLEISSKSNNFKFFAGMRF